MKCGERENKKTSGRGRERVTSMQKEGETEGSVDRSVGVFFFFIGVMRREINKRGEKSLLVLRAPSPRQLKGPSKSRPNQRLNKDRSRRCFGWPPLL